MDWVSPRQAVACGCPGAGVHPLVCEAGLQAGSGCSWTGPGPRRVWVWSLPTGGWTWAPGSTGADPCVPIQHLSGVRGWLSGGCRGLKDSSNSLSAGEGCGRTSLPAWLLGLRLPMLCVLLGARCCRYWARGRVPPWRWPAAASLGRDQLPAWLPPVSCPQCHGLPLRDTPVSRWVQSGSFEVPASALGCGVCEAPYVPAGAESLLPTPRGSPTGLEALHSGGSPSLAQDPSWGAPQPLAARRRPPWLVALPRVGRPSCRLAAAASLSLVVADPSWPAPSQWSFWRTLEGCAPGLLLHRPGHPLTVVTLEDPGGPCSGSPATPSWPSPRGGHSGGPCSGSPAPPSWPSPRGRLCVCVGGCSLGFGGCPSLTDVSLC